MTDAGGMQDKLGQLGVKFLERTLGEIATLQKLLVAARSGEAPAREELRHLAHRMHGTGATLGFPEISEQAGHIERLVEAQPVDFPRLADHTAALERETRAAAQARGLSI
jgi:HPt (histidine-containing phosphotransfer) domain-containing protein